MPNEPDWIVLPPPEEPEPFAVYMRPISEHQVSDPNTYESIIDATNPGFPWELAMSNAAVPIDSGVLAYKPRLHPPPGSIPAYPVNVPPGAGYPSGGAVPLVSVALNAVGSWPGRIDFKVTTGASAVALAAYLGAPGVTLDKAAMPRYPVALPPSATDAVVTIGDASVSNIAAQNVSLGRQWSFAAGKYIHANSNLDNRSMYSSDGVNWSSGTVPTDASPQNWNGIAYSPELNLFAAIASGGGTPTTARAMTSPDGLNWTIRTLSANSWGDICWSPSLGLFCAVHNQALANNIATSPDGINWTLRTKANTNGLRSVCWSPELNLFVATGNSGTGNRAQTSPDGINWTTRNTPADNDWFYVCWSPQRSLFVAVANVGTGGRVMTSPDGITWTQRNSIDDASAWNMIACSPALGLFAAVSGGGGARGMYSTDGITWSAATGLPSNSFQAVCWSPELACFIATNNSGTGNRVYRSFDGKMWTAQLNAPISNSFYGLCWAGPPQNKFVAVATTNGVNSEKVWWKGVQAKAGEVWRLGANVEEHTNSGGASGFAFGNPGYEMQGGIIGTTTGLKRGKNTPTADADWLGFAAYTGTAITISDVVAFRETPACLPQGLYDVHVCHVDQYGAEGSVTKFSNVNVV